MFDTMANIGDTIIAGRGSIAEHAGRRGGTAAEPPRSATPQAAREAKAVAAVRDAVAPTKEKGPRRREATRPLGVALAVTPRSAAPGCRA